MNIHTYLEKKASKGGVFNLARDVLEAEGHTAISTALHPITTFKRMKSLLQKGDEVEQMAALIALPGAAMGYVPYAYGGYKGGKKVKDYLNDKRGKR